MADRIYNLYEAKTSLSRLVDRAVNGDQIVIAKAGVPLVKLVRLNGPRKRRKPGGWEGKVRVAANFDDPLPRELRRAFEGRTRGQG